MDLSISLMCVCFFTFLIHCTESLAYSMRLAGVRSKQIAIAMAFVTSTLLVSRLSNMFQAPLLGFMVDSTILVGTLESLKMLEYQFRFIILFAFLGAFLGAFLTPTLVVLFQKAIQHFQETGSIPKVVYRAFKFKNIVKIVMLFKIPKFSELRKFRLGTLPRQFLIVNIFVTSIYVIGVLCSLLAGAYLPEYRSTAMMLSGIVNGMATIMFTIFVDPAGARITDQAMNGLRPVEDVRSVVFYLQMGKMLGTLIVAQLLLWPASKYIMWVTEFIKTVFH